MASAKAFFTEMLEKNYLFSTELNLWTKPQAEVFSYSDGEQVEQQLLEIIQSASDVSSHSTELTAQTKGSWPLTYHLHRRRSNLLRPIQHLLTGQILEVGAGCGAITRFLGETGSEILALEGSQRRATVAAARCRDLPNVTVLVEQFHQLPIMSQYDVVTLIGVLEYARIYFPTTSADPVDAMLVHAKKFLKPDGILVLAIENQLGLKYFAGYAEDHTGQVMLGIEDRYRADGAVTFGRRELAQRLTTSGFSEQQWWFPFPDYKVPVAILSEYALNNKIDVDLAPLLSNALVADPQTPEAYLFSLEQASQVVIRNGLWGDLANSFLVVAGAETMTSPTDLIGYHYATDRRPEFTKVVTFSVEQGQVTTRSRRLYPNVLPTESLPLALSLQDEVFISGQHWQQRLYLIINQPNWSIDDLATWMQVWLDAFLLQLGFSTLPAINFLLPGNALDALPCNLIITTDGKAHFIDQEWQLEQPIEFGYVVFRALFFTLYNLKNVASPSKEVPLRLVELLFKLSCKLGVTMRDADLHRYLSSELDLQYWVYGVKTLLTVNDIERLALPVKYNFKQLKDEIKKLKNEIKQQQNEIKQQQKIYCALKHELTLMQDSLYWRIIKRLNFFYKIQKKFYQSIFNKSKKN